MSPPPASGDLMNSHPELIGGHRACRWCGSSYSIPTSVYQAWSSYAFPFHRYGWFSVTALTGLVTLTFDLSTSKWGHGSHVSWASFTPIFCFLCPSVLDLGQARDRLTDGQTDDGHQRLISHSTVGSFKSPTHLGYVAIFRYLVTSLLHRHYYIHCVIL